MKSKSRLSPITNSIILSIALVTSSYGASGKKGYTDKDLIDYGVSKSAFKASLLLQYPSRRCTINSVKIKDNDPYDFYITAGHCANIENVWNRKRIKERLEEERKLWPEIKKELLSKGIISPESRSAEIKKAWNKYRNSQLNQSDTININAMHELKCVLPDQSEVNSFEDIALCTLYQKRSDRPKYEVFITKHFDLLDDEVLTHVGFGRRETGDPVLDRITERQAFKTVVNFEHDSWLHGTLWSIPFEEMHITGPIGAVNSGDSGGALLYENEEGHFYLVGVTSKGHVDDRHAGIWVPPYEDFIEKAYQELISKNKDEL